MAIDAVPHHLADESPDLPEAGDPVELGRPHRHLVANGLRDQRPSLGVREPGLPGGRPQARLDLHSRHEQLEVARREVEVGIELAHIVELVELDRLEPAVEGFDDPGPYVAPPAVAVPHDAQVGEPGRILLEDGRRLVGRAVVDHHPERGWDRLGRHAVECPSNEPGLVATGRDEEIASILDQTALRKRRWQRELALWSEDVDSQDEGTWNEVGCVLTLCDRLSRDHRTETRCRWHHRTRT